MPMERSFLTHPDSELFRECLHDEKICVVIPMYRVESHILDVVNGIPDWVAMIIAVDDASPDQSAEKIRGLQDPRITLVSHPRNQGVGGAVMSGYQQAVKMGATIIVKMDGDNQMDPQLLPALVWPILQGEADYTKGNRFVDQSLLAAMPFVRRSGNLFLSFIIKVASGYWNIFDPTNGFTAIDAELAQKINPKSIHPRYFFESSMLVELNLLKAKIVDVNMPARYQGEQSSMSIFRVLLEFPPLIIRALFHRLWLQYFLFDFSLASLYFSIGSIMMVFGTIWGLVKWVQSLVTDTPATTGTVMLAVLPLILGFQLLLQAIAQDVQKISTTAVSAASRRRKKLE